MEIIITQKPQEKRENLSPTYNPSNSSNINNGSSTTPKPLVSRSDINPYPTTFVQADTSTFKQVVQMLTGSSSETSKTSTADPPPPPSNKFSSCSSSIPPIKSTGQKKQGFKLYERRNSLKNGFIISPLIPSSSSSSSSATAFGFSPRNRQTEILSPSILDFPSLLLSPVTPLNEDPFYNNNSSSSPSMAPGHTAAAANSSEEEEEKAIAEKKFYLHPSPRTAEPPQLLPLFPVTSPRLAATTSSSSS